MGEKVGFMTVLFIVGTFVIPLLLSNFIDNVKANKVLTASTEMQQLIQAEGGLTDKVLDAARNLKKKGINTAYGIDGSYKMTLDQIEFILRMGGSIKDFQIGTQVEVDYDFDGFKTSNTITILNRN